MFVPLQVNDRFFLDGRWWTHVGYTLPGRMLYADSDDRVFRNKLYSVRRVIRDAQIDYLARPEACSRTSHRSAGQHTGLWDAGDWLAEYNYSALAANYGFDPVTVSDDRLAEVADALDAEARAENVALFGTYDWLIRERNFTRNLL
jgi:hypothetical protein